MKLSGTEPDPRAITAARLPRKQQTHGPDARCPTPPHQRHEHHSEYENKNEAATTEICSQIPHEHHSEPENESGTAVTRPCAQIATPWDSAAAKAVGGPPVPRTDSCAPRSECRALRKARTRNTAQHADRTADPTK